MRNTPALIFSALIALTLTACGGIKGGEAKYPTGADRASTGSNNIYDKPKSIFGDGGIKLLGGDKGKGGDQVGLGVNALLWRASLDTISFMPITSADPFGGTIITDWYSSADAPDERFKVNIFILGRELRADGIKVTMFRQTKGKSGWNDAAIDAAAPRQLEDAILTRARELRIQSQAAGK